MHKAKTKEYIIIGGCIVHVKDQLWSETSTDQEEECEDGTITDPGSGAGIQHNLNYSL